MPHPFEPIYNESSRVLILGTTPSPHSIASEFYYGHPRNRFWPIIARIVGEPTPDGIAQKRALLLRHHIALWDVLAGCDINGAADASIRNAVPNDIDAIFKHAPIRAVFLNGTKAYQLYNRFFMDRPELPAICLPSTSPANASFTLERLYEKWIKISDCL